MRTTKAALLALLPALGSGACDRAPVPAPPGEGLAVLNPSSADRPTFHDFDRLAYGQRAEHVFRIQNRDPDPVTIRSMLASCSCAVPRIRAVLADGTVVAGSSDPSGPVIVLPPGSIADLAVAVDTVHVQALNADKLAMVRIVSDSRTTPFLTLEMHLVVERLFRAVPAAIDLGLAPRGAGKSGRADLSLDVPGARGRILGIASVEGPFTATLDPTEVGAATLWVLAASLAPGQPLGPATGAVVLETTGPDGTGEGAPFRVRVSAQVVEDVILDPPAFAVGPGHAAESTLQALVPGERVQILSASAGGPGAVEAKVVCTPVDPGQDGRASRWRIELRVAEDAASGEVVLSLDHPRVREVRASFFRAGRGQ